MADIQKATSSLVLNHRFFATLLLKHAIKPDTSEETAAIDGTTLTYNPAYIKSLGLSEAVGLLAHEVLHVANLHHTRIHGREEDDWNIACDYVVNDILVKAGFTLPEGFLLDSQYAGLSAEDIYGKIKKAKREQQGQDQGQGQGQGQGQDQQAGQDQSQPGQGPDQNTGQQPSQDQGQQGQQPGTDPGKCGRVKAPQASDGSGHPSEADLTKAEQKAILDTLQAAQSAKGAGFLPAEIAEYIETLKEPKEDWHAALWRFAEQPSKNDYSFARPNVRYAHTGVFLPSLADKEIGDMVIVLDVSGSTYSVQGALDSFLSEAQSLLDTLRPRSMRVIQCDSKIAGDLEYLPGDTIETRITGGGGTRFQPALDYAEQYSPVCLVYFTDMECFDTPTEPSYPVLWAIYGGQDNHEIGFGERIYVE